MKHFDSEKEMQQWLSSRFAKGEALADMISNYEDFKEQDFSSAVKDAGQRKICNSFQYCLKSFENNDVVSENIDISMNAKDVLKPDFIVYAPETQSILIIELKNIKGPTRQAGTEISAYAAEIRTYLPYLAEGDIVNVIISNDWPTLLKHYIYNEIVWLNKWLICLEPEMASDGIGLKIIDPLQICDPAFKPRIWAKQLGGYQLCLYDDELYRGGDYFRMGEFQDSMFAALHAMSAKGNALKAHGFAFLWRHCHEVGLAPYNITIMNFASFQTPELVFRDRKVSATEMGKRIRRIIRDHAPEGHSETLDTITTYGETFLKDFCSPMPEGFESWDYLRPKIFEGTDAIAFVGWGLFQDLFFERMATEPVHPESGHRYSATCPLFAIEMLDQLIYDDYQYVK
ncbi:hypothetical protein DBR40_07500 [Pedobacter sp. KBW01]|uniref:hypothetical protein n=1 Tax=Pedobacter sp. KBW01 TaxID=2153364 RepID=UPI000F59844C|nr:hypothetical protein [Pedobacter sp. KBW01]RQO77811.1 hypothetical protein DBR40_07500 [Pedobacter sp. KBW01]